MNREIVENIVDVLIEHKEGTTQDQEFFFWRYLECCCELAANEVYILDDLALLAEILKEKKAQSLIEPIMLYDYVAGQHLERLVLTSA
ncbi:MULTISPECIES: hypothetical protein [unclassified Bacillus (in: firmicutes)]|uniref:hypothetical protein n=1 Tax=unclassified Bacillus (in: firmicutes) TaxID=185979 RepID=UPI0008EAEBF1|nr:MULTISPECIES: hypothetical protein [unclassified Bacillus (in: firmicutes)]SFB14164.1 hypothetical protein SAMN02799634_106276 [Bacillus sp. UNCCL13]SFQ89789.1 hypothetical protein SAMN04488577_3544 [Bacillus sp. cl95]